MWRPTSQDNRVRQESDFQNAKAEQLAKTLGRLSAEQNDVNDKTRECFHVWHVEIRQNWNKLDPTRSFVGNNLAILSGLSLIHVASRRAVWAPHIVIGFNNLSNIAVDNELRACVRFFGFLLIEIN